MPTLAAHFSYQSCLVPLLCTLLAGRLGIVAAQETGKLPIPDRLIVLTFDDSVKSHYTVARPILKKYGFGATFFITRGFSFETNKKDYMTWEEIASLDRDGFEIGNHTRDHISVTAKNIDKLEEQLRGIDESCRRAGIRKPTSFAWPGNSFVVEALPVLRKHGIVLARRGGRPEFPYEKGKGVAYEPGLDDPMLIPSAGDARPDWTIENFIAAVKLAREGRVAIMQFHGVPEGEHPWVHTSAEQFEADMRFLHEEKYKVIALRDLVRYVDPAKMPTDPLEIIERRRTAMRQSSP